MADFEDYLPSNFSQKILQEGAIEPGVVAQILSKCKLGPKVRQAVIEADDSEPPGLTFKGLHRITDFPLALHAVRLTQRQQGALERDLMKTPTQSSLYIAWQDLQETHFCQNRGLGLVCTLPGSGRQYWIFHNQVVGYGTVGRYYTIEGKLFFLEPLESVLARFGPSGDW